MLGLGKADVNADFPFSFSCKEELQRNCCLTGTRTPLKEVESVARQPALHYLIQTGNARGGPRQEFGHIHYISPLRIRPGYAPPPPFRIRPGGISARGFSAQTSPFK